MKVVILCGGFGTRLREETEIRPKPMVEIGGKPILWHIMKIYSHHGFNEFVLCLGYKAEVIKEYFYNYQVLSNDFTIELGSKDIQIHSDHDEADWKVTLVDTGLNTMTGGRVKRVARFIEDDTFMLTYGDGVTDLDLGQELSYHREHGQIGTIAGVSPPSRYGELSIVQDRVVSFQEKPEGANGSINGGYFIFQREFFDYLDEDEGCVLERDPLERLAADGGLKVYHHRGFWQCMDTYRDYKYLNDLWDSGRVPWKLW